MRPKYLQTSKVPCASLWYNHFSIDQVEAVHSSASLRFTGVQLQLQDTQYISFTSLKPYSESYPFPLRGSFWHAVTGQVQDGCVKLCKVAVLSCLCQWKIFSMSICEQSISSVPRYVWHEDHTLHAFELRLHLQATQIICMMQSIWS